MLGHNFKVLIKATYVERNLSCVNSIVDADHESLNCVHGVLGSHNMHGMLFER